jgi:cobalt-zinc-cadmium efflux system membrane fusion protein
MFKLKILILLLIAPFMFSCERIQPEPENKSTDKKKESTQVGASQAGAPVMITLKPESLKEMDIKIDTVSLESLKVEYAYSGLVEVNDTRLAHVGSRIPGRAVDVFANLGNHVKKGDRLAVIDSQELGEAQNQFLKAMSNLDVAGRSYERAKMLLDGKVVAVGEFQRREGEYLSAKADAKAAEDRLHLVGMTEEEISSIGGAHTINSRVAIYAPISGTVIEKHLTMGEVVEPVASLFVITDIWNLWVIADIPEKDIPKITKGQKTAVTVSSYPERAYRGEINYVSDVINRDTRMVKVRAEVENKDGTLKPGMFASMKISVGKRDALVVPDSAVQREGEKTIVFIANGENSFEKRTVKLGPQAGEFHEALSGVKAGERIVTKGAFTLKSEGLKGLMEGE